MKGKHEIRSEKLSKRKVSGFNRDVVVFAFFLFLSFVFWYVNSLGKEIEAGIIYPVKYINLPDDRLIPEEPQTRLNIYLKGYGYSILKLKLSGKRVPVEIDFSKVNFKRVTGSKAPDYFIVTSGIAKSLALQLRSGCEITSIKPDTLFFTFEKAGIKSEPERNKIQQ